MYGVDLSVMLNLVQPMNPLMALAIILVGGLIGERLAQRLGAPGVTGNLAAGFIIGPSCLNLLAGMDVVGRFAPMSMFAMVFIALAVGSQLSYQRIHNALGRILWIAVGEALMAHLLVSAVAFAWTKDVWASLLLGTLAIATAPTTTLAVVRESKARGPFVKTLVAVVAVDCSLCILAFSFVQGWVAERMSGQGFVGGHPGFHLAWQLLGSVSLAAGIAASMELLVRRWNLSELVCVFLAILVVAGLSQVFLVNRLLVGLVLGVLLMNFSHNAERYSRAFEPIEVLLFTGFFTLAGVSLHWHSLSQAGPLCLLYILARVGGKGIGAFLGGKLARSPERIARNIPMGLVPQAGVAVGLIIVLQNDMRVPASISELVSVTVLAAIAANEILGPFLTRAALRRAKEVDQDRPKLMDFLQEEFIASHVKAVDKWDAIRQASDFYLRTHRLPAPQQELVRTTILDREHSISTAIGHGIAIPHGRVEGGKALCGVLLTLEQGVDFGAPDGDPVRIIILIVTPREHEQKHAQVLASLSTMLSDAFIRDRLVSARSAHDVWEIIEDEEYRDLNYFLEEFGEQEDHGAADLPAR